MCMTCIWLLPCKLLGAERPGQIPEGHASPASCTSRSKPSSPTKLALALALAFRITAVLWRSLPLPSGNPGGQAVYLAEAAAADCPDWQCGAANLMRRASMPPLEARKPQAAGRRWLRSYFNGCAFKVFDVRLPSALADKSFLEVAEWMYRTSGLALLGACVRVCVCKSSLQCFVASLPPSLAR